MIAPSFDSLVVLGPTASGKTRLGVALARIFAGEIISADSRQVFRGMDLGTGKDLVEYNDIPYHLIDLQPPGTEFSVYEFLQAATKALTVIRSRQRLPVVVGGTGLYLDALLKGYRMVPAPVDPVLRSKLAEYSLEELQSELCRLRPRQHNRTDLDDRERLLRAIEIAVAEARETGPSPPQLQPVIFGLHWPREVLRQRIRIRLAERLEQGLLEEVSGLVAAGVSYATLDYYGLEYRFIARFLRGELKRSELETQLAIAIGQFAKRQETWFRRMERQGTPIQWLDAASDPLAAALKVLGQ
jgi:tRNA dimethylallyltransferase